MRTAFLTPSQSSRVSFTAEQASKARGVQRATRGQLCGITGSIKHRYSSLTYWHIQQQPCCSSRAAPTAAATAPATSPTLASMNKLQAWLIESNGLQLQLVEPQAVIAASEVAVVGFVATQDIRPGQVLMEIPGDLAVTSEDVGKTSGISQLAEGHGELIGLALWIMAQRQLGPDSPWRHLVEALPRQTATPILWQPQERECLLRGSPALQEAAARDEALRQEWAALCSAMPTAAAAGGAEGYFTGPEWTEEAFRGAVSVAMAHAAWLPAAQCFALLPLVGAVRRTGDSGGATLDYDPQRGAVTLVARRPYRRGQEISIYDGRSNGELLLARGSLEEGNPADQLSLPVSLVAADRMYSMKQQILAASGFEARQEFPVTAQSMPIQLLVYARLSRIQNPAELAVIDFAKDTIVSQNNEYEVLQLLMGDCREKLAGYGGNAEEDLKMLQRRELTEHEQLAAKLRLSEKRIWQGTMDGLRRRLAPIRGIPTKSGAMKDPNADLNEVFETIENIPNAPKKLLEGFVSWARGDSDPDWKKTGRRK